MALFGAGLDWVVAVFLVLVFAEYIKIRAKSKGFNWIAASAVSALLGWSFSGFGVWGLVSGAIWGQYLFEFIAWILLLIGAITVVLDLSKAK